MVQKRVDLAVEWSNGQPTFTVLEKHHGYSGALPKVYMIVVYGSYYVAFESTYSQLARGIFTSTHSHG
jgi:hypothetical protein